MDKNNKVDCKIEHFYKPFNFEIDDRLEKHSIKKKFYEQNKNIEKIKIVEIETNSNKIPIHDK